MNLIDDLNETKETWFNMEGGGKVQFRLIPPSEFKKIQAQTTKKKIDYHKVDGTPGRWDVEIVDTELQNELFWDKAIASWDEFSFKHPETKEIIMCTPQTCTKENKLILINCSKKFLLFANDSMKALAEDDKVLKEELPKN